MAKSAMNKASEHEDYYQELGGNGKSKIFDTMKDVFMFAAAVGYKYNKQISVMKRGGEPIALRHFSDDDKKMIDLLALSVTNDISILFSEDEFVDKKYEIVESLANGGMGIMIDAFCKPVIDEAELFKFVESFEDGSRRIQKVDIASMLRGAMDSLNNHS